MSQRALSCQRSERLLMIERKLGHDWVLSSFSKHINHVKAWPVKWKDANSILSFSGVIWDRKGFVDSIIFWKQSFIIILITLVFIPWLLILWCGICFSFPSTRGCFTFHRLLIYQNWSLWYCCSPFRGWNIDQSSCGQLPLCLLLEFCCLHH